jgi:uncharacterized protein (DUF111 family)
MYVGGEQIKISISCTESFRNVAIVLVDIITKDLENDLEEAVMSNPFPPSDKMATSSLWLSDYTTQVECNLDDATGELLGHVMELLLEEGALDAWASPIVMKKGRPAHTLHCLCHPDDESKILEILFRHTTTLGIRIHREIPRAKLCRSFHFAQTPYRDNPRDGRVQVKVSSFVTGEIVSIKPEFDDCQSISRASGVPLKIVAQAAMSDVRARRLDSNTGTGIDTHVADSL